MHMPQNMILKLKSMFLFQKETFIKRRKLFKMLPFMILIWQTQGHKYVNLF